MARILPGLLWSFVLAIALWPTFLKPGAWRVSGGWRRVGAPLLLTLLIAVLVAAPVAFAAVEVVRESESFMGWINDARAHGIALPPAAADIPWVGGLLSDPGGSTNLSTPDAATLFFEGLGPRNLLGLTRNLGPELLHRALLFGITLLTLFFLFRDGEELAARVRPLADRAFGQPQP